MNVPAVYRRSAFLVLAIILVLSGCAPSPAALTTRLLGRWQRVDENSLIEPYVFAECPEPPPTLAPPFPSPTPAAP